MSRLIYTGLVVRNQTIPKPACSATVTAEKAKILLVANSNIVLSNKLITKALIRLRGCLGWSAPGLVVRKPDIILCEQQRLRPACNQCVVAS